MRYNAIPGISVFAFILLNQIKKHVTYLRQIKTSISEYKQKAFTVYTYTCT